MTPTTTTLALDGFSAHLPAHEPDYSERWVDSDDPSLVWPYTWRNEVAGWPHDLWVRWRQLSSDTLSKRGTGPHAVDTIRECDRYAYVILKGTP